MNSGEHYGEYCWLPGDKRESKTPQPLLVLIPWSAEVSNMHGVNVLGTWMGFVWFTRGTAG
jgi:hypothetical protein